MRERIQGRTSEASKGSARDIAVLVVSYVCLSLVCYWGYLLWWVNVAMAALWPVRWLLGPPAALLERMSGFAARYALGTLVVLTLSTLMLVYRHRQQSTAASLGGLLVLAWIGWGVYEWLISM